MGLLQKLSEQRLYKGHGVPSVLLHDDSCYWFALSQAGVSGNHPTIRALMLQHPAVYDPTGHACMTRDMR